MSRWVSSRREKCARSDRGLLAKLLVQNRKGCVPETPRDSPRLPRDSTTETAHLTVTPESLVGRMKLILLFCLRFEKTQDFVFALEQPWAEGCRYLLLSFVILYAFVTS